MANGAAARKAEEPAVGTYEIQGRVVTLPVEVRDASNMYATYVVPSEAARRFLPPGLQLAELLPGSALCTLGAVVYRDNDLGQYNEMLVAFMVQYGNRRPRPLLDLLRGKAGAYIHRLPVDQSFTCEAGCTIWGYPKTIEAIAVDASERHRTATLHCGGEHVFTLSVRRGGRWPLGERPFDSYSYREGRLRRTPFVAGGSGAGFRLGGAALTLGPHPIADELRSLGLPRRALLSGSMEQMRASFGAPETLGQPNATIA